MAHPPRAEPSTRIRLPWEHPLVFAGSLAALAFALSLFFAKFRLGGNDEGALLTAAGKILRGGLFYRDIDAYPFPGAHYLLAGTMALFGEQLGVARGLAAGLYVALVVVLYRLALPLLGRPRAALFGVSLLAFKLLAWPAFTAFFYWDLAFLSAVSAIALFLCSARPRSSGVLLGVGLLTGLSFVSKQNVGVYLALALGLVLAWERGGEGSGGPATARSIALGFAGFAAAVLPGVAWFAWHGVLVEGLYSGLVRPFTDYVGTSGIAYGRALRWWELGSLEGPSGFSYFPESVWTLIRRELLPGGASLSSFYWLVGELFVRGVYTAMPLAFAGAVGLAWRDFRAGRGRPSLLTVFACLAGAVVLSAFPRTDFAHMMGIYPLVLLLGFAVSGELFRNGRAARIARGIEAASVGAVLFACGVASVSFFGSMTARLELERARLWVWPEDHFVGSVVRYVDEELREGEPLFVYGYEAYYYFLSGHYSPWPFSQLYPGQAGSDDGASLARLLESDPPPVVVQGFVHFPGVPGLPTQVPRLQAFLEEHYQTTDEPFRRHPPASGKVPPEHRLQVLRRTDGTLP